MYVYIYITKTIVCNNSSRNILLNPETHQADSLVIWPSIPQTLGDSVKASGDLPKIDGDRLGKW